MKILILCTVVLTVAFVGAGHIGLGQKFKCIQNVTKYQNRIFESEIRAKIEEIRKQLKENGIPALNITSLDPLIIDNQRLQVETPFQLDLNISQRTDGLLGFDITDLNIHLIGLKFDFAVNWPSIKLDSQYGFLLNVIEKEFYGNGDINAQITNFAISGRGSLKNEFVNGKLLVLLDKFELQLKLGDFTFKVTGLMNDEELSDMVSKIITDSAQIFIDEVQKEINADIAAIIEIINNWIINNTFYEVDLNPFYLC